MKAMKRKPVAAMVDKVNEALRLFAARASGREDELRAELAKAEAERDRLIEAIASGGEAFASVRDRLATVEEKIAATTADLERVRFSARAAQTPTAIPVAHVMAYLRGLRKLTKTDVAKAKTALTGLLDGDLDSTPRKRSINRPA